MNNIVFLLDEFGRVLIDDAKLLEKIAGAISLDMNAEDSPNTQCPIYNIRCINHHCILLI